ncbi:MAG: helix-turn-helix domain-containing protein [Verrucomicrobiota bacterium]
MNYSSIQLLGIGRHMAKPDWRLAMQVHTHHEVIIITAGRQFAEVEGTTLTVSTGDVLWFPQNVVHTEWADPNDPVQSLFAGIVWPELPRPLSCRITDAEGRISQLARWLYAEREHDPAPNRPITTALTQTIVAEYLRLTTEHNDPRVGQLRKFMRQHFSRTLTLDDLAAAINLSKFHFIRRYRSLTGRTPMEDLRLIRLEAARDLLLTTNLPLKEIAPRCGLGDEFHLCRLFRRQFRTSPGQFRQHRRR